MFCILCVRASMFVSERQVICPHVAPAAAQLKNIFGYTICKHAHIRSICDTYACCETSAEAEEKHGLCVCLYATVCMCKRLRGCVASTC